MSAGNQTAETETIPINQNNQPQYTTLDTSIKTIFTKRKKKNSLNLFNKLSLTYINVVNYNQRRALYPFATFFSFYYEMSDTKFAWIISAFHLGGFLAIVISAYMIHFRFNLFLIIMLVLLSITNIFMVIWYSFTGLLVLRILSGLICTITWAEVTGSIGAFTDEGAERTTGIIITESSFTITTLFYVVIGLILKDLNVTWFWMIMAAMGIFGAGLACFLPKISLYEAGNAERIHRVQSVSSFALMSRTPEHEINETEQLNSDVEISRSAEPTLHNDTFSLKSCIKAYSKVTHLMMHFFLLFCMSTQFSAFSVTFGEWLVVTYSLNAAQLGYFTIANTLGGVTALIIAPILSKFKPNLYGIIIGSMGVALMTFVISLLVWTGTNYYTVILIFFYLYWTASQVMFLNIIVCNLDFSPKGYESTSSLIFQMIARGASFIGTIIGPNVVEWISFPFLINLSCILFVIATILYTTMYRYLNRESAYEKLRSKKENETL